MTWKVQGIPRPPADPIYDDAEVRKSNLLLEAKLLHEQGEDLAAAVRLAEAARIETDLATYCEKHEFPAKARVHRYSAMACWGGAGNIYQALIEAEVLLGQVDLPEALRDRVEKYVQTLRTRLRRWHEDQRQESAEAVAS